MCELPDAVLNSEVDDLHKRIEKHLSPALQYACRSWHKHIVDQKTVWTPEVTSVLYQFLEKKFLFWLEVLSVLGAVKEAVDVLVLVARWLGVCLVFPSGILLKFTETGSRSHQLLTLSMTVSIL